MNIHAICYFFSIEELFSLIDKVFNNLSINLTILLRASTMAYYLNFEANFKWYHNQLTFV